MQNRFPVSFHNYACIGDTITTEIEGFEFEAKILFDPDYHIDDDDSHNMDQSVTGCSDKQQQKLLAARDAWSRGDWSYCGIFVGVKKKGIYLTGESLWGLELNYPGSDNSYLSEAANELLGQALIESKKIIKSLCT